METARDSGNAELVEQLLRFFVEEDMKDIECHEMPNWTTTAKQNKVRNHRVTQSRAADSAN